MLKKIIKEDARLIWHLLIQKEQLTTTQLEELTGYRDAYLYLVLGWLSRENLIDFVEVDDNLTITIHKAIKNKTRIELTVIENKKAERRKV